jgi:dipeptide/tripeptide permease
MRTTLPEATESVSPLGLQRLFRFGAWCFIVVGFTHLLITGVATLGAPDPATQRAVGAMRAVPTTLPGIRSDMAQLYQGFSAAMALLGIGFGLLNLVVLRLAPDILVRGTVLLWVDAGVSALLLAVAVLAFPAPPILATAAALAAYGWALAITRRGRA